MSTPGTRTRPVRRDAPGRSMRTLALSATFAVAASAGVVATGPAAHADTQSVRLRAAVRGLPVATEVRTGYERSKFRDWYDADDDCQDTRDEVLTAEALVKVTACDVKSGEWRSYYDGVTTKDSSTFDIDHMVPLAEAWDSGARRWTTETRARYANDLGDGRALVAVSASSNRSKGDQDPAEWMPALAKCRYVREYVAVKMRWRLSVNKAEKTTLTKRASTCKNVVIKVRRAAVELQK
ncbi:Protein of unknown function [Nocardioides scoriae]|uniref:GmrSD restriction endonucleases C-terminal domain-containing protein n=1 Tax=Nocardioides scoriae TaxID=642780 RepID=A0A1H1VK52_9ACTN|nr:HNH endonuclease family protein [Nocardioides scoriae]SDS85268.1 Protein of unknown function [Nocardioides scoriae]